MIICADADHPNVSTRMIRQWFGLNGKQCRIYAGYWIKKSPFFFFSIIITWRGFNQTLQRWTLLLQLPAYPQLLKIFWRERIQERILKNALLHLRIILQAQARRTNDLLPKWFQKNFYHSIQRPTSLHPLELNLLEMVRSTKVCVRAYTYTLSPPTRIWTSLASTCWHTSLIMLYNTRVYDDAPWCNSPNACLGLWTVQTQNSARRSNAWRSES